MVLSLWGSKLPHHKPGEPYGQERDLKQQLLEAFERQHGAGPSYDVRVQGLGFQV